MAKIYTKTGDKGETGLVGGKRVPKDSLRIEAYGDVDELNAVIGVAGSFLERHDTDIQEILQKIQEKLFVVGADLATTADYQGNRFVPKISEPDILEIEKWIDQFDAELPKLENFILPSGTSAGALLHCARTVCRRAERHVVRLSKEEAVGEEVIRYLNRVSDFLFVLARTVNWRRGALEIAWIPRKE